LNKIEVFQGGYPMSKPFRDHYFQRAKKESYAARSVYKLQEIQKKYKLLRRGDRVLDLGAAPGSWMQLACEAIGPKGHLVGVDLKKIEQRFPTNALVL
jgi:23S rRNA (uridine2552-2'-O)-methyltransferase